MVAENEAVVEAKAQAGDVQAEAPAKAAEAMKPAAKGKVKKARKAKSAGARPQVRVKERTNIMTNKTNNIFAGFGAFPGASAFEKLFADAAERSEEAVKKSRKTAEELADLYRGNLDAFVEAGRIAATGAQSIGQTFAAKGRDSIEQTANTVRSLAEAKNPSDLLQLQGDYARGAFDRFVEDSSALTESLVKLAGEAFQPISNRASANIERLNTIAA